LRRACGRAWDLAHPQVTVSPLVGRRGPLSSNGFAGWVSYSIVMRCGSAQVFKQGRLPVAGDGQQAGEGHCHQLGLRLDVVPEKGEDLAGAVRLLREAGAMAMSTGAM
jgi:hypothetical protein